jgi:hypothetical protein
LILRQVAKFLILLLFTLCPYFRIFSQTLILQRNSPQIPETYLKNLQSEHRKIINLNGEWYLSASEHNINTTVQVPFCYDFKGRAVCSRSFNTDLENPDNWNYVLCCDGINYQCEITINGKFIEKHEGGYTPFSSLIQESTIKEYGNNIEIVIDNSLDNSKTIPLKNINNYPKNYGGIYRDIYIIAVPKIFIRNIDLKSEIDINFNTDITNTITVSATDLSAFFGDNEKKFTLKTEVLDTAGNVRGSSETVAFSIADNSTIEITNKLNIANPESWTPDNPYLYTLRVILSRGTDIIDILKSDYGTYEFTLKSGSIYINRSELKLEGVNYVEEIPGSGIAASYADIERDIKNIKSLGCNTIKIYGRAASPYLVNLCSRYGLFIFEEVPVFNVPSVIMSSDNFISLAENFMSEMVHSNHNYPSILAFGIGNDFNVTDAGSKTLVEKLSSLSKSIDNKLVYYSTRNYNNDQCRQYVDLVGLNIYDMDQKVLKEILTENKLKKERLFIAGYGKVIDPSNVSGYSDPNSVESQSKYIVDFHKLIKNYTVVGSFFISFADWNSDSPNLKFFDKSNPYLKSTGLYSFNREQRSPAVILRKEFLDEDIPNLNIGTYAREAPIFFVLAGLVTFILFIYLANNIRRFRENAWRAIFRPFIFFSDVREQTLLPSLLNVLMALILSIASGLFFANLFNYWKDSPQFDLMLTVIFSSGHIKSFIDNCIISPVKLTILLTAVAFIKIFIISCVIWFFSLGTKFRVGFKNIYTVTVWGLSPTLLLLIIGIFYIRVLYIDSDFVILGLILAGLLYILSIYRILKGTYIIFDTFFVKAYAYGILTILFVAGGAWYYLNSTKYVIDYLRLVQAFMKY